MFSTFCAIRGWARNTVRRLLTIEWVKRRICSERALWDTFHVRVIIDHLKSSTLKITMCPRITSITKPCFWTRSTFLSTFNTFIPNSILISLAFNITRISIDLCIRAWTLLHTFSFFGQKLFSSSNVAFCANSIKLLKTFRIWAFSFRGHKKTWLALGAFCVLGARNTVFDSFWAKLTFVVMKSILLITNTCSISKHEIRVTLKTWFSGSFETEGNGEIVTETVSIDQVVALFASEAVVGGTFWAAGLEGGAGGAFEGFFVQEEASFTGQTFIIFIIITNQTIIKHSSICQETSILLKSSHILVAPRPNIRPELAFQTCGVRLSPCLVLSPHRAGLYGTFITEIDFAG